MTIQTNEISNTEYLNMNNKKRKRRKPRQLERYLQIRCINWFRLQYPQYDLNIFAVGNGGSRNVIEAANLKRSGVLAGVSDMLLLLPNKTYHALCIEFKKDKNAKQTENQINFQLAVEKQNYKYVLIFDYDDFVLLIKNYLNDNNYTDNNYNEHKGQR